MLEALPWVMVRSLGGAVRVGATLPTLLTWKLSTWINQGPGSTDVMVSSVMPVKLMLASR